MRRWEVFFVPTISAQARTCRDLFAMWRQFDRDEVLVVFDFSQTNFIRPRAVAFIAGLIRMIEKRGGAVRFKWDTLSSAVRAHLAQNGFMQAFGGPSAPWKGNCIPYLHHQESDPNTFAGFVQRTWLGRGWLGVSDQLAQSLTSSVGEIYVNAFEHAESPVGFHCCGQFYPKMRELSLTFVDFGVGIPSNVRNFQKQSHLTGSCCMEWAFQQGTSTRLGQSSGGLGLDNLYDFVRATHGRLEVYSHEGYGWLEQGLMHYQDRADQFQGTMVSIRVPCDDRYYVLGSEIAVLNPF